MNSKPLVSVVMPVAGRDLNRVRIAINSINEQSLKGLEMICVVDDPPNKELIKLVSEYRMHPDNSLSVILNARKRGIAYSLNRGIECARAKYIARMDADDISMPGRIERQYEFMETNLDVGLVGMQAMNISNDGCIIGKSHKPMDSKSVTLYARYACPLIHPTWLIRTELIKEMGGYLDISPAQDYHFICRLLRSNQKICNLADVGLIYTVCENSLSRRNIYKTVKVTNIIRKSLKDCKNYDSRIKKIVKDNKKSRYFEVLYNARRSATKTFRESKSFARRLLSLIVIFISSILHLSLLIDTVALLQIYFLPNR